MVKQLTGLLVCAVMAVLLTGCGGGTTTAPAATGRLTLKVIWPQKTTSSTTRLIPLEAGSILAVVTSGSQNLGTRLIVGSDGPPSNPSTVTFTNLPAGTVTLTASAYPGQQGTGVALAAGSQSVTIVSGQTATVSVTMASTIDHVTITPEDSTIAVGQIESVTMNAFDVAGNMVIVPFTADFVSANTNVATFTIGGNPAGIQGVSPGTSVITVTERDSGKTATATVTVTGNQSGE